MLATNVRSHEGLPMNAARLLTLVDASALASFLAAEERINAQEGLAGTETAYRLAKNYRLKTAFGTDIVFSQALSQHHAAILAQLVRWHTPAEALLMKDGQIHWQDSLRYQPVPD
jgi:imidazolonepropionase-like amidohydrolase